MEIQIDNVIKHLRDTIANQAQEIAILKSTIDMLTEVKPTTTASTPKLVENGTQGIKPAKE
jgi:hypothetical protein